MKKGRPKNWLITTLGKFHRTRVRVITSRPNQTVYRLDLSGYLCLAGVDDIVYIENTGSIKDEKAVYQQMRDLIEEYGGWRDRIKIFSLPVISTDLDEKLRDTFDYSVTLTESTAARYNFDSSIRQGIGQLLREQIELKKLVPYQYQGAVTGYRFFGRETQLRTLSRHPNISYLVSGNRMSGKTSFLLEAKRRIEDASGSSSEKKPNTCYVDCRRYQTFAGVATGIFEALGERTSIAHIDRWMYPNAIPTFCRFLRDYTRQTSDKRLYLFLDEYDQIVDIDSVENSNISWNFRSLKDSNSTKNGFVQFVIAGSKALASLCQKNDSHLYNFLDYEGCQLTNFDVGTIRKVIQRPVEDLSFEIERLQEIVQRMLDETAGRPSSVQYLCRNMVEKLLGLQENRLQPETLIAVVNSASYSAFYESSIYENTDALEQFILCSQSQMAAESFKMDDVLKTAEEFGVHVEPAKVFESLQNLTTSGFLTQEDKSGRYECAVPLIRRIFAGNSPGFYIKTMLREHVATRFL